MGGDSDVADAPKNTKCDEDEEEEKAGTSSAVWARNTENPDFQLAQLDATTRGFQSKLNVMKGSYVITGFVDRAEASLSAKGYVSRIGPMFKEMQFELGQRLKKQQPTFNWANNTENIQFFKREVEAVEITDSAKCTAQGNAMVENENENENETELETEMETYLTAVEVTTGQSEHNIDF